MSQILVTQARLDRTSGITADAVVNTFHHILDTDGDAAAVTGAGQIHGALVTFYAAFDQLLANTLSGAVTFKTYTLAHPAPRAPVVTGATTLGTLGADALPGELAVCLSYRAAQVSGVPAAQTRGRIYIGPLARGFLSTTVAGDVRPLLTSNTSIRNAAIGLANAAGPDWCVWSPTTLTARPIIEVSTDDAFDIQRRRGAAPTSRVRASTA
jgi:hypothetical protein